MFYSCHFVWFNIENYRFITMEKDTRIIIFLFCLFYIINTQSSNSPIPVKNPYFQTGKRSLITTSTGSPTPINRTYEFPFAGVIPSVWRTYYTTLEINSQTFSQPHPNNNNVHFMYYNIYYNTHSSTHLSTNIYGYFQNPYILSITIMFILIFDNNPFINDYIVFRPISFTQATNTYSYTSYPNKYSSGNNINYACLVQSLTIYYMKNDLANNNYGINFELICYSSSFWRDVTTSRTLSSSIQNYNFYRISMLVIIVDTTAISNDFPNYKVRADYYYSSSSSFFVYTGNDITLPQNNFIGGFMGIYYYNYQEPSFKISISDTTNGFDVQFYGSISRNSNSFYHMKYSYFSIAYYECPKGYFIYKSSSNLCYDGCASGEYYDPITQTCQQCSDYCDNCNSFDQCLSCVSSQNRQLINYKCKPKDGYYQAGNLIAAACTSPCLHCSLSPTNCTKCIAGYDKALSNFKCELCSDIFDHCTKCIENKCMECQTDYFLLNSTFCKHSCQAGCASCDNFVYTNCQKCMKGYSLVFGKCLVLLNCGDGYVDPSQQCDDGAFIARDGCSPYCTVQSGYQCHSINDPQGVKVTTHCAFINNIDFTVVSQEKMEYSNQIEVIFSVQYFNELFWNNINDLSTFFRLSTFSYKNLNLKFLEKNHNSIVHLLPLLKQKYDSASLMVLKFEYLQPINKKVITLSFDFSKSVDKTLTQIPLSSKKITLLPDNNRIAQVYSDNTYRNTAFLAQIFELISYTLLIYLALSYFVTGRMLVAQSLMVFQIAYVSILAETQLGPYSVSLTHLRTIFTPINPNTLFNIRPFDDAMNTTQMKGMQLFSQFILNFNLGCAFVIIPFIFAIFAAIMSCLAQNEQKINSWKKTSQRFATECVFSGLIYAGCIVGVSSVLQLTIGITQHKSFLGLTSLVEMGILLLLFFIYGILRIAKRQLFGQAETMLLQNANHSLAFQILLFYSGIIIGSLLTLYGNWKWINTTIAAFFILLYILTLGKEIFRSNKDRYRTQFNLLTLALTQASFIYNRFRSQEQYANDSDASLMIPAFGALILLLNFVVNSSFFIYLIIKKVRQWYAENQSQKKIGFQVFDMSTPLPDVGKPKYRKGFIEYSEGSEPQLEIEIPNKMSIDASLQKHSPPLNQFLNPMESTHPLRKNAVNSSI